jgi:hypothetical protein
LKPGGDEEVASRPSNLVHSAPGGGYWRGGRVNVRRVLWGKGEDALLNVERVIPSTFVRAYRMSKIVCNACVCRSELP